MENSTNTFREMNLVLWLVLKSRVKNKTVKENKSAFLLHLFFVTFIFCYIYFLLHLSFVTFIFCYIYFLLHVFFVTFIFLLHLFFVTFNFCYI